MTPTGWICSRCGSARMIPRLLLLSVTMAGLCAPAMAETLFTKSQAGTVSLVKDLDAKTCDIARLKALGQPATEEERLAAKIADDQSIERVGRWAREHGCQGWGVTSQNSFVTKNGDCFVGSDLANWVNSRTMRPDDIIQAECLK